MTYCSNPPWRLGRKTSKGAGFIDAISINRISADSRGKLPQTRNISEIWKQRLYSLSWNWQFLHAPPPGWEAGIILQSFPHQWLWWSAAAEDKMLWAVLQAVTLVKTPRPRRYGCESWHCHGPLSGTRESSWSTPLVCPIKLGPLRDRCCFSMCSLREEQERWRKRGGWFYFSLKPWQNPVGCALFFMGKWSVYFQTLRIWVLMKLKEKPKPITRKRVFLWFN